MDHQHILSFIEELGVMKLIPRTGWLLRGIGKPESVADHAYRMAVLAMLLADLLAENGIELDADKVTRMALLHEIGEARVMDIPAQALPYIPQKVKHKGEGQAVAEMLADLGHIGETYRALWQEFEAGKTLEAKVVKAADRLELLIQAYQYEQAGYRNLADFWENATTMKAFKPFPQIVAMVQVLAEKREKIKE